jgi:hypothetical protein
VGSENQKMSIFAGVQHCIYAVILGGYENSKKIADVTYNPMQL